ncbi:MAG: permease [Candidatus Eiseniibacteriota bacterium]|nr:MAG: permease [Candidatus Eisenbacteria bacterium]
MNNKRRKSNMLVPTIVLGALAIALFFIGYSRGEGQHIVGMKSALRLTIDILPMLAFAFIVAGMVQTLLPHELLSRWVGAESGARGIFIGAVAGGMSPGGPFVNLPIAAGLLHSGASVGTLVAFLTGWSLWAVSRLPMEVGILGWRFTLIRIASVLIFPPLAGFIAQRFFSGIKLM